MAEVRPVVVAAVGRNGAIGRRGTLPWHLPEDLRHFRRVTLDHVVLMGRRTWESIGRPLPRRKLVVLSRRPRLSLPEEVMHAHSLSEGLERAAMLGDPEPRIIGGASVYAETLPMASELWLTEVDILVPDADTFFPEADLTGFDLVERRPAAEDSRLRFLHYVRRRPLAAKATLAPTSC